jgi:hypothetical protein
MTCKLGHPPTRDPEVVAAPTTFRTIAKRIGNLATNLLVTGVILIVGIAFAREVISWWRGDSISNAAPPIAAVAGDRVPDVSAERQLLEFGDFPFVLNRQEFVGDVTQVLEQLRAACRTAIDSSQPLTHDFGPAEQRMLRVAMRLAPVEEQANRWSIHQIVAPLPMVVGVRSFDPQVAYPHLRVVTWGLAVPDATPAGERQTAWTLFTTSSDSAAATTPERWSWPAPPGGQRTLLLRIDRGGVIVGYAGVGVVESWTKFYDDLFAESPPQSKDDWQVDFGSWRRRFTRAGMETVDIVIHPDGGDTIHSLVITSPHARDN